MGMLGCSRCLQWAHIVVGLYDGREMQMPCFLLGRETTAGVTAASGLEKRKAPQQPRPRSLRYSTSTSDNRVISWTAA